MAEKQLMSGGEERVALGHEEARASRDPRHSNMERKFLGRSAAANLVQGTMQKNRDLMEIKPTGTPPGIDPEQYMADALDEERVSPEEQQQYERFVLRAVQFIDGPKTQKEVLRSLNQPDMPVHAAIGRTAAKVAQLVAKSAKAAGQEVSPDVIYHAGKEIVEVLAETGSAAGILPLDPQSPEYEDVLNMAFLEGAKAYGEDLLRGPEGKKLSQLAGDFYAKKIAEEADAGTIDPAFAQSAREAQINPVAAGVKEAVGGNQ